MIKKHQIGYIIFNNKLETKIDRSNILIKSSSREVDFIDKLIENNIYYNNIEITACPINFIGGSSKNLMVYGRNKCPYWSQGGNVYINTLDKHIPKDSYIYIIDEKGNNELSPALTKVIDSKQTPTYGNIITIDINIDISNSFVDLYYLPEVDSNGNLEIEYTTTAETANINVENILVPGNFLYNKFVDNIPSSSTITTIRKNSSLIDSSSIYYIYANNLFLLSVKT